jgi:hypothetical protein
VTDCKPDFRRLHRIRFSIGILALGFILSGCGNGNGVGVSANGDVAQTALRNMLDAWSKGTTPADLMTQSPRVVAKDSDWVSGAKLMQFQMNESALFGNEQRIEVLLTLQPGPKAKNQKVFQRRAVYLIETTDPVYIPREDD